MSTPRPKEVFFSRLGFTFYRQDIGDEVQGKGDYMHRWILSLPWGHELCVHHILRSDVGVDWHDHPFDFWSLLLTGGYFEKTPLMIDGAALHHWTENRWYSPWSLVRRKAEFLHRLELVGPVWTLVWAGPRRRDWGFQTQAGWVDYRDYKEPAEPLRLIKPD